MPKKNVGVATFHMTYSKSAKVASRIVEEVLRSEDEFERWNNPERRYLVEGATFLNRTIVDNTTVPALTLTPEQFAYLTTLRLQRDFTPDEIVHLIENAVLLDSRGISAAIEADQPDNQIVQLKHRYIAESRKETPVETNLLALEAQYVTKDLHDTAEYTTLKHLRGNTLTKAEKTENQKFFKSLPADQQNESALASLPHPTDKAAIVTQKHDSLIGGQFVEGQSNLTADIILQPSDTLYNKELWTQQRDAIAEAHHQGLPVDDLPRDELDRAERLVIMQKEELAKLLGVTVKDELTFAIHADETTVHGHYVVRNIDPETKQTIVSQQLQSASVPPSVAMSNMQTEYAIRMFQRLQHEPDMNMVAIRGATKQDRAHPTRNLVESTYLNHVAESKALADTDKYVAHEHLVKAKNQLIMAGINTMMMNDPNANVNNVRQHLVDNYGINVDGDLTQTTKQAHSLFQDAFKRNLKTVLNHRVIEEAEARVDQKLKHSHVIEQQSLKNAADTESLQRSLDQRELELDARETNLQADEQETKTKQDELAQQLEAVQQRSQQLSNELEAQRQKRKKYEKKLEQLDQTIEDRVDASLKQKRLELDELISAKEAEYQQREQSIAKTEKYVKRYEDATWAAEELFATAYVMTKSPRGGYASLDEELTKRKKAYDAFAYGSWSGHRVPVDQQFNRSDEMLRMLHDATEYVPAYDVWKSFAERATVNEQRRVNEANRVKQPQPVTRTVTVKRPAQQAKSKPITR